MSRVVSGIEINLFIPRVKKPPSENDDLTKKIQKVWKFMKAFLWKIDFFKMLSLVEILGVKELILNFVFCFLKFFDRIISLLV
jgi:hypothetical protein